MPSAATGTQEGGEVGRGEVLAGLSERLAHVESALSRLLGKGPAKVEGEEGGEGESYDEAVAASLQEVARAWETSQGFTLHLRAMLLPMLHLVEPSIGPDDYEMVFYEYLGRLCKDYGSTARKFGRGDQTVVSSLNKRVAESLALEVGVAVRERSGGRRRGEESWQRRRREALAKRLELLER